MKTVCIVQARLGSKRLPRKVLLPLNGHTVIGEVLTRCSRISGVDEVVCAIPAADHELADAAGEYCGVIRCPEQEDDVLARYVRAADYTSAKVIMRITGDCPLICPEVCNAVLALHRHSGAHYTSNIAPRTFPQGYDCEVFVQSLLQWADEAAEDAYDREHVTPIMRRLGSVANLTAPWPMEGRLCLDTEDDYKVIKAYFESR